MRCLRVRVCKTRKRNAIYFAHCDLTPAARMTASVTDCETGHKPNQLLPPVVGNVVDRPGMIDGSATLR